MADSTCTTCGASLTAGSCSHCQAAAIAAPAHAAEARLPMPTPPGEGAISAGLPPLDQAPLPSIRKDLPSVFGRFVPYVVVVCLLTTAVCLLVPSVERVRVFGPRLQTINNMKVIGLACHEYCDTHKHLPTPKVIADGRDVELSWRVAILPYLDQQALHAAFDLSLSWKSPKNFPLSNQIIHTYGCPYREKEATNRTRFQQCVGPETMYPHNAPVELAKIHDGSSNTILFAEADHHVHWPRPADMAIQPDQPLPLPEDLFQACMADGTVRQFHREKISDTILRQLIHPNDGQPAAGWDN